MPGKRFKLGKPPSSHGQQVTPPRRTELQRPLRRTTLRRPPRCAIVQRHVRLNSLPSPPFRRELGKHHRRHSMLLTTPSHGKLRQRQPYRKGLRRGLRELWRPRSHHRSRSWRLRRRSTMARRPPWPVRETPRRSCGPAIPRRPHCLKQTQRLPCYSRLEMCHCRLRLRVPTCRSRPRAFLRRFMRWTLHPRQSKPVRLPLTGLPSRCFGPNCRPHWPELQRPSSRREQKRIRRRRRRLPAARGPRPASERGNCRQVRAMPTSGCSCRGNLGPAASPVRAALGLPARRGRVAGRRLHWATPAGCSRWATPVGRRLRWATPVSAAVAAASAAATLALMAAARSPTPAVRFHTPAAVCPAHPASVACPALPTASAAWDSPASQGAGALAQAATATGAGVESGAGRRRRRSPRRSGVQRGSVRPRSAASPKRRPQAKRRCTTRRRASPRLP
mmetsp:Transcript_15160/g.47782  ORF Transcript_15160/g.47782 Transcript_15160/m.47782 type:complete len:448 (-) Transcript_15160:716-2059(-)